MSTTVSVSRSHEGRPLGVGIAGPQVILVSGIGCSPKNSVSDHAEANVVTFGVLAGGAADGGLAGAFGDGEAVARAGEGGERSEEHMSELQSLMRSSYAVFCLKKTNILH